jgi:hypothetical protein
MDSYCCTSLRNSNCVNGFIRPAVSRDPLIPVIFHRSTLWEDGGSIEQARYSVESNERPEEPSPLFARQAIDTRVRKDSENDGDDTKWS